MSAGGGDQYCSYNAPAAEDGILKVIVDGRERHARDVSAGDPILPDVERPGRHSRLGHTSFSGRVA